MRGRGQARAYPRNSWVSVNLVGLADGIASHKLADEGADQVVRVVQLQVNSGTNRVMGYQMEHWLQLMCCALAVVLIPYFGNVGGRSKG